MANLDVNIKINTNNSDHNAHQRLLSEENIDNVNEDSKTSPNHNLNSCSYNDYYEKKREEMRYISENVKIVYLAMIVGIVLSLLILSLGGALLAKSAKAPGITLVVFGMLTGLAFGWGIYATKTYAECNDEYFESDNVTKYKELDQSSERTYLNIALYLMMLMLLVYLIISIGFFAYQNEALIKIKGIGQDEVLWKSYFGKLTYQVVISNTTAIMTSIAVISLLLFIFEGLLLIFAFRVLGNYRTWQAVIQFICVLFLIIGFASLYFSVYSHNYREVTKVDKSMPAWVPDDLMCVSFLAIAFAVFGYISAYTENANFLRIFTYIIGAFTMVIIIIAIGSALYAQRFKSFFEDRCTAILDLINKDYLVRYIGCERKYLFTSDSLENMQCPKDRIVTDWEVNLYVELDKQKESYGCLDMSCCYQTYSFVKSKVDYPVVFGFFLFLLSCLLVSGSWYMLSKLERGEEKGISNQKSQYFFYVVTGVVVICMIIFICLIPSPPQPSPTSAAAIHSAPFKNTKVNAQTVIVADQVTIDDKEANSIEAKLKNETVIEEDTSKCGPECLRLRYTYELSSNDGIFNQNESTGDITVIKNEQMGNGWIVSFDGSSEDLKKFTEYFVFTPNCPLDPAKIHINVTATAYKAENTTKTTFLQLKNNKMKIHQRRQSSNEPLLIQLKINSKIKTAQNTTTVTTSDSFQPTIIDVSSLKEGKTYDILDKDFDHSFINKDTFQIATGQVVRVQDLETKTLLDKANVKLSSLTFPQCNTENHQTGASGQFTTSKLYLLSLNMPIEYKLEASYAGLVTGEKIFQVGGLGWTNMIALGRIELWPATMAEKATLSSFVIHSIENERLNNVTVTIYKGYLDFDNEIVTNNKTNGRNSFLQVDNKIFNSTITDKEGQFRFDNLVPSTYTLLFSKQGFYREVHRNIYLNINPTNIFIDIDVIGSNTKPLLSVQMTPLVEEGQVRFVLTWPDGPKDLDIHSMFKISKFSTCEVYFGKRECVGTELDTDNVNGKNNGVETITISTLGNYIYTFAVHKYFDTTDGVTAKGKDTPVPGAADKARPNNSTRSNATIPDDSLSNSDARISVYTSGFKGAIYQIHVPVVSDGTVLEKGKNQSAYNWWLAFCLNGKDGINSLLPANKLTSLKPNYTYCENYYSSQPTFIEFIRPRIHLRNNSGRN